MLTEGSVHENIQEIKHTRVPVRHTGDNSRNENVKAMNEHLPYDLLRYVEGPEANHGETTVLRRVVRERTILPTVALVSLSVVCTPETV